jgi:prepilin signal peptidase PulO-like enzyme (type II secretory pathway)
MGAILGFFLLASVRYGYYWYSGEHGMGDGDPELLATIGAFVGPMGCWLALMIGSCAGSLVGLGLFMRYGVAARKKPLPFGPFLAIGAFITVIFHQQIMLFLASCLV